MTVGILTLRTLDEARRLYPTNVDVAEAKSLHNELVFVIELALSSKGCEKFKAMYRRPAFGDSATIEKLFFLQAVLMTWHPDVQNAGQQHLAEGMESAMRKCERSVPPNLEKILARIHEILLFDCRIPHPVNDKSYQDPRRFLQLLKKYWGLCRQIMLTALDVPVSHQPHALTRLILNLKSRFDSCFQQIKGVEGVQQAQENVNTLINGLLVETPTSSAWYQNGQPG